MVKILAVAQSHESIVSMDEINSILLSSSWFRALPSGVQHPGTGCLCKDLPYVTGGGQSGPDPPAEGYAGIPE